MAAQSEAVNRAITNAHIAKLKFKQTLSRGASGPSNLPPVPLDDSTQFCAHLDAVFAQDTPQNIQTCKQWILKNIIPSETRIVLLGDFLVSLSKATIVDPAAILGKPLRNRLDILLVVNDVLHALKFHIKAYQFAAGRLAPYIDDLVGLVGSCLRIKETQTERNLTGMIKYWRANALFDREHINSIVRTTRDAIRSAQGLAPAEEDKPVYKLPDKFGQQGATWHNAPASYMLDRAIKCPGRSITADSVRLDSLGKKYPSESVCEALDEYFAAVDVLQTPVSYQPVDDPKNIGDIRPNMRPDAMGHVVIDGPAPANLPMTRNGYGWTLAFAEEIQSNDMPVRILEAREQYLSKMDVDGPERDGDHTRYRNAPRSRSPRYRRYNDSRSSSRSSYRSREDRSSSRDSPKRFGERQRPSRFDDGTGGVHRPLPGSFSRDAARSTYASADSEHRQNLSSHTPNNQHHQATNPGLAPHSMNMGANLFPPHPPAFPAQFPVPSLPPPFPIPSGVPMASTPVPPPNLSGPLANSPFHPAVAQTSSQSYKAHGSDVVHGDNTGYNSFNQSGFQGNGSDARSIAQDSHRGTPQRGRGGRSRWN